MSTIIIIPPDANAAITTHTMSMMSEDEPVRSRKEKNARRSSIARSFMERVVLHHNAAIFGIAAADDHPELPRVLDALGIILADEETIDASKLKAAGATLIPNFPVSLVYPVTVETAEAPNYWHLEAINVAAARAKQLTGSGIWVGVLDTGIDGSHPEFAGKNIKFQEFDESGNPVRNAVHDTGKHGTHVCGLIAGVNTGVAPSANLAVAAVLTRNGRGSFAQILAGLNWLIQTQFGTSEPGVDIISASLGAEGYIDYFYSALQNAAVAPGTHMIAAIGNNGRLGIGHHGSPGNYDIVTGVGATDQNDNVADFSDWGPVPQFPGLVKPDLCAPGVDVISAGVGGGYLTMSGTSMATPIVSGAVALLMQQDRTLIGDVPKLLKSLYPLVQPANPMARAGRGRLDLSSI